MLGNRIFARESEQRHEQATPLEQPHNLPCTTFHEDFSPPIVKNGVKEYWEVLPKAQGKKGQMTGCIAGLIERHVRTVSLAW